MIPLTHQEHPAISIMPFCDLLSGSRSGYYERSDQADPNPQDIALRDEKEKSIMMERVYQAGIGEPLRRRVCAC